MWSALVTEQVAGCAVSCSTDLCDVTDLATQASASAILCLTSNAELHGVQTERSLFGYRHMRCVLSTGASFTAAQAVMAVRCTVRHRRSCSLSRLQELCCCSRVQRQNRYSMILQLGLCGNLNPVTCQYTAQQMKLHATYSKISLKAAC